MPNCVILLWIVWNKSKNKFMVDQFGLKNTFNFIGLVKYPYTNTTHVFSPD